MKSLLFLLLTCSLSLGEEIKLTANQIISEPIIITSNRTVINGNGFILSPSENWPGGAAVQFVGVNYCSVSDLHIRNFPCGIEATDCNYLTISRGSIVDCLDGLRAHGNWDCTYGPALHILRSDTAITVSGTQERFSNPNHFIDVHIESYKRHAIVIDRASNFIFTSCKFHANKEVPPLGATIFTTRSYPVMVFLSGEFMFSNKHFENIPSSKVVVQFPITDNAKSFGSVKPIQPLLNDR